jgi:hypothetical protein
VKFMLLIHFDQETWLKLSVTERQKVYGKHVDVVEQLMASKQYLAANSLLPPSTTASVRIRDGKQLVTHGPFSEMREPLGGYILIEAKDLDEAVGIAARLEAARLGAVEVRTVREGPPT